MAEEKERRIEAAVSVDDETLMEETYIVSVNQNGDTREVSSDELERTDPNVEDQGTEQEPAAWAGRVPLSRSLSAWREDREKERLVTVCMVILEFWNLILGGLDRSQSSRDRYRPNSNNRSSGKTICKDIIIANMLKVIYYMTPIRIYLIVLQGSVQNNNRH